MRLPRRSVLEGRRQTHFKAACLEHHVIALRLPHESYDQLCRKVLQRDGWRCQSCGSFTNLQIHHKEFRSRSGDDSEDNRDHFVFGLSWMSARRKNEIPGRGKHGSATPPIAVSNVRPEWRDALPRRYGAESSRIQHAEAFEITEYGRQPPKKRLTSCSAEANAALQQEVSPRNSRALGLGVWMSLRPALFCRRSESVQSLPSTEDIT